MRVQAPGRVVGVAAAIVIGVAVGSAWWWLRTRPTIDGVAGRIDAGRYRVAESELRQYLETDPGDELANLLLARVLVERSEPEPEEALRRVVDLRPLEPQRAAMARAIEGDAQFLARRYDRAETAWLEAIRLEPTIPEVGWKLLNIYAVQGREDDSKRLALTLFAVEPDPRDRVQLLLQLIRHDAHSIEAGSIVHELEPIVRDNPGDFRSSIALGGALIRSGRADDGLAILRRSVRSHPDDPDARLAYLDGLIDTGDLDELARSLEQLPSGMASSPRFDVPRGWLAAQRRDLDEASRAYRRALDSRPSDPTLAYRLKNVLRQAGRDDELASLSGRLDAMARFPDAVRALFDKINELPDLGLASHPEVFEEVAGLLAQVGRRDEADAWGRLVGSKPTKPAQP